jgi:putative PIN family toxin of toxin-antitoxin system
MATERVVFDTATIIAGLLSAESAAAHAIERAVTRAEIVVTSATLRELIAALLSPKLDAYVSRERRDALLLRLAPFVEIVAVVHRVRAAGDVKWDTLLEAAANGRADAIVSDQRDAAGRSTVGGVAILTPGDYVNWSRRDSAASTAVY